MAPAPRDAAPSCRKRGEYLDPAGMTSSPRPVRLLIAFVVGVAGFIA